MLVQPNLFSAVEKHQLKQKSAHDNSKTLVSFTKGQTVVLELSCALFYFVDVDAISSLVVNLDVHKAARVDGPSPRLLKASPYMVRLIAVLVNMCIASSSLPSQWKQANVTPVPKCKQYTGLSHLWPISVLPTYFI